MCNSIKTLTALSIIAVSVTTEAAIYGLVNTGTDIDGTALPVGTQQPSWIISTISPLSPLPGGGVTTGIGGYKTFVVQPYVGNLSVPYSWLPQSPTDSSQWISYSPQLWEGGDVRRDYTYTLKFDASSADSFRMRFSADQSARVYLNSIGTGNLLMNWGNLDPIDYSPWHTWSPWLTVSGLSSGQNTLIFVVGNINQNYLNPTGLRAEFVVPEPSTAALLLLPVLACGLRRMRKN